MGGGGGGAKAKIKIEQGKEKKQFEHEKSFKKNSTRDFSIGKIISCVRVTPNLENKTFFDISNGVRKVSKPKYSEDIGAKKVLSMF